MESGPMRNETPLLKRFLTKIVHDVLPAAMASLIGGFMFTHFQLGLFGNPPQLAAAQVTPASAEMMQLLRDEHSVIVDFLNAERAKEERQLAADESMPRATVDRSVAATAAARHSAAAALAAKSAALRSKALGGSTLSSPLVIAQAQRSGGDKAPPRNEDGLIAKTIGLKDNVVAVTQRVVSTLGVIPSWIGSIGDHIGGENLNPRPPVDLISES
jgi:hypothetical protein